MNLKHYTSNKIVLTNKQHRVTNAQADIGIEPQNDISDFCINEASRQIIDHSNTASFSGPQHDNDHQEEEDFRLSLKMNK